MCACFLIASCSAKIEKEADEAYLLVQSSRGFLYSGERLVVTGTSPNTIFFSDRPVRKAGHLPLEAAYAWGRSGDDTFLANPPNAALTFREDDEVVNVILTISDAVIDGDTISFNVNILEGQLPDEGGLNTLFVDGLGLGLGGDGLLGGVRDAVSDEVSDRLGGGDDEGEDEGEDEEDAEEEEATGASSIVEELTQLKALLDNGLITQEDYDAKKKELLDKL